MESVFNNNQASFHAYLDARGLTPMQYRQAVEEDIIAAYMRSQQRRLTQTKEGNAKSPAP
jgi:hypothetical protein